MKASEQPDAAGFVWNQRGWAQAALNRNPQARESFVRALDHSTTTADQAEAQLGLGMIALKAGHPQEALAPLRSALLQGPYAMAAASYELAQAAQETFGKKVPVRLFSAQSEGRVEPPQHRLAFRVNIVIHFGEMPS